MAKREILSVEHPMLRRKCAKIHHLDASLQRLVDDLIETMYHANGVGLAAPQVGVPVRLFVAQTPEELDEPHAGELFVLYNPEVVKTADLYHPVEGCLSMPGWEADVPRYRRAVVKGRNRQGKEVRIKAEGLLAQALQHETDHLNGVLFFDHLENMDQLRRIESAAEAVKA